MAAGAGSGAGRCPSASSIRSRMRLRRARGRRSQRRQRERRPDAVSTCPPGTPLRRESRGSVYTGARGLCPGGARGSPPVCAKMRAMADAYTDLTERWGAIADLGGIEELIGWDERTKMPAGGAEARAEAHATLARLRHELLIDDGLWELLERLAPGGAEAPEPGSLEADIVAIAHRNVERARRVPTSLRAEMARAASRRRDGLGAGPRRAPTSAAYLPHLERNIELAREYAACFPPGEHPYDALLDEYEPGMPTSRGEADPRRAPRGPRPDRRRGRRERRRRRRLAAARRLRRRRPAPRGAASSSRCCRSTTAPGGWTRPCTRSCPRPARRHPADDALHPGRHLLRAVQLPARGGARDLRGRRSRRAARAARSASCSSLSFHESQSRLWENWVGRSRPYLAAALPVLQREFGGAFASVSAEDLYRAANKAQPSLVRVEADEVTYNLHIALRFELELELIDGSLAAADLADAWAERTREYLGLEVPDHKHGVMQDVHWAGGAVRLLPHLLAGQRHRGAALGAGRQRARRPRRSDRRRRRHARAAHLADRAASTATPPDTCRRRWRSEALGGPLDPRAAAEPAPHQVRRALRVLSRPDHGGV